MRKLFATVLVTATLTGCLPNQGFSGLSAVSATDASVIEVPTVTGVGFASMTTQPGRHPTQKRLMAIRASRMAAMRELAEQIHGLKIEGNTTVVDMMIQNDSYRATVNGLIRGARTVRINPKGSDTYETVLELDENTIRRILMAAPRPRQGTKTAYVTM